MYSIGDLYREFKLSRSTLLYYDKIGLLNASTRTESNYRQYSEEDKNRLNQICTFREAGVPLHQIKDILDIDVKKRDALGRRLAEVNQEVRYLKLQQKFIVEMLKDDNPIHQTEIVDSQLFESVLRSAGLDDGTLELLHLQFDKNEPDSHQLFLEFLGISEDTEGAMWDMEDSNE